MFEQDRRYASTVATLMCDDTVDTETVSLDDEMESIMVIDTSVDNKPHGTASQS